MQKKIVVGITGASGACYAIKLIEALQGVAETHLVISKHGEELITHETNLQLNDVIRKAKYYYNNDNLFAPIASGSFKVNAMVIVPCSMKTLAAVSQGYAETLICRAADVCLKENRKLIIVPREMPLSFIHLENMLKLQRAGACIMPACPAFYNKPQTIDDLVNNMVGRILDSLEIENNLFERWGSACELKQL